jgi:DNA-binding CsgD family transcriptional regulator
LSSDYKIEREEKVLELYNNQGKTTRDIAKEQRLSLRDISHILKKHGVNHGITSIDDDDNNSKKTHSNNEKATQAYKLFSEGKKPVEVAILLGLSERQATRYYTEYWRLKRIYKLHFIYKESNGNPSTFLRLYKLVKRLGIRIKDLEWFVGMVEIGTYKIPEIQNQYAKIKNELEAIDYKKTMAKYELQNINNQIAILNRDICSKRNDIAYLHFEVQELDGYLRGLKNHIQQGQPIS